MAPVISLTYRLRVVSILACNSQESKFPKTILLPLATILSFAKNTPLLQVGLVICIAFLHHGEICSLNTPHICVPGCTLLLNGKLNCSCDFYFIRRLKWHTAGTSLSHFTNVFSSKDIFKTGSWQYRNSAPKGPMCINECLGFTLLCVFACLCAGSYYCHSDTQQEWQRLSRSLISPADKRGCSLRSDTTHSQLLTRNQRTYERSTNRCTDPVCLLLSRVHWEQQRHTAQTRVSIQ